jgi:S-adenosylmethionine-diacylgycerolhomoserine-N-methlytransferase
MDEIYRYQRYIYDLTRKFYLLGRDQVIDELAPPRGGKVLEVACGTGRNLIKAARRYPHAHFYGFDISEAMLDTARASISRAGLTHRIRLATGDASDFSAGRMFGVGGFDRVFVSYALSMIPPWRAAVDAALGALAQGGRFHVVDFGTQEDLPDWFRLGLHAWLARFSVEPRAELENELGKRAASRGLAMHSARLYRGYAVYAVLAQVNSPSVGEPLQAVEARRDDAYGPQ